LEKCRKSSGFGQKLFAVSRLCCAEMNAENAATRMLVSSVSDFASIVS